MDNLKDRMYNFEVTPPAGVWESIAAELDGVGLVAPQTTTKKTGKKLYFILAAAACVAALVFSGIWFISNRKNETNKFSNSPVNKNENLASTEKNDTSEKMTAPKSTEKNTAGQGKNHNVLAKNTSPKKQTGKPDNNSSTTKNDEVASDEPNNSYITIAGPEGQAVRVSSKVSSLIESQDNNYPPKPIWNKKINKWKDIMKANTLTPTTGNFLDIVDLTNTLKEK